MLLLNDISISDKQLKHNIFNELFWEKLFVIYYNPFDGWLRNNQEFSQSTWAEFPTNKIFIRVVPFARSEQTRNPSEGNDRKKNKTKLLQLFVTIKMFSFAFLNRNILCQNVFVFISICCHVFLWDLTKTKLKLFCLPIAFVALMKI